MSNAYLCPILQDSQFNNDGTFLVGGQIWFYEAGTSTPVLAYTTPNADVAWTNPIVLNARGETGGEIWLLAGQDYKIIVEAPPYYGETHGPVVNTFDNIAGVNDPEAGGASVTNWVQLSATPVYINAASFSVAGDLRSTFVFGRRVRLTKSSGVAYGMVVDATFALGSTTITLSVDYGSSLNSSISAVYYGAIETGPVASTPVPVYAGSALGGTQYDLWLEYDGFNMRWARDNLASSNNWPINAATADQADLADVATSAGNGINTTISADLSASRAFNTTYTNSSARAMIVYVSIEMASSAQSNYGRGLVDGSEVLNWAGTGTSSGFVSITLFVPAGDTYRVNQTAGSTASIARWVEQN